MDFNDVFYVLKLLIPKITKGKSGKEKIGTTSYIPGGILLFLDTKTFLVKKKVNCVHGVVRAYCKKKNIQDNKVMSNVLVTFHLEGK